MLGEHKFIKTDDGLELHTRILEKGHGKWMIVTHGIGEHLERHNYMTDLFSQDYNILHWDLRGHGRSMGKRAYVENFANFTSDLRCLVRYLIENYKMNNYVLFGHSMGGLITCYFVQNLLQDILLPQRVLVNAPPAGFPGLMGKVANRVDVSVFEKLSGIPYSLPLKGLVDSYYLSHDPSVKEKYDEDELNVKAIHSKLVFELIKTSKKVTSKELGPSFPMVCTYGTEDKIIDVPSLEKYFRTVEKNVDLIPVVGAFHEIHNEVEKYRSPYYEKLKEFFLA